MADGEAAGVAAGATCSGRMPKWSLSARMRLTDWSMRAWVICPAAMALLSELIMKLIEAVLYAPSSRSSPASTESTAAGRVANTKARYLS